MSAAANATADPGSSTAAAADPTSSSSQEGVGGEAGNHEGTPEVEEVAGAGVPVIRPALVYNKQGDVVEVPEKVVQAVDGFRVPDGFVRKGAREQSYMYSLGVYCEKTGSKDHKFFCCAGSDCRRINKSIPCKNGDRSNVNTHLKSKHDMQGTGGVTKDAKKKETQASVQESFNASMNSGVGKNRCVCVCVVCRTYSCCIVRSMYVQQYSVLFCMYSAGNVLRSIDYYYLLLVHTLMCTAVVVQQYYKYCLQ